MILNLSGGGGLQMGGDSGRHVIGRPPSAMDQSESQDFSFVNQNSRDFSMTNHESRDFSMANQDSRESTQSSIISAAVGEAFNHGVSE